MVSHRHSWAKLGRNTAHRLAMLRNMVTSVIKHEAIQTTHAKAKACQRMVDRMITLAKENTVRSKRAAGDFVREKPAVDKLFTVLANRYTNRPGGYTRVVHLKHRLNDAAPISILELVDREGEVRPAAPVSAEFNQLIQAKSIISRQYQIQFTKSKTEIAADKIYHQERKTKYAAGADMATAIAAAAAAATQPK